MQSGWLTRWTGWLNISRIIGIVAGLIALALAGRKVVAYRTKGATERLAAKTETEKAVLAEAGIEKARHEANVVHHATEAMMHEEAAQVYERKVAVAKARVARLRSGE